MLGKFSVDDPLGLGLGLVGTLMSLKGGMDVADAKDKEADAYRMEAQGYLNKAARVSDATKFTTDQLRQKAPQQVAAAQRDYADEMRKGRHVLSAAIARAAASGGGAQDPSMVRNYADIVNVAKYRALSAIYQGEVAKADMLDLAAAKDYEAQLYGLDAADAAAATNARASVINQAAANARGSAMTNALTEGLSMFSKYAKFSKPGGDSYVEAEPTFYGDFAPIQDYNSMFASDLSWVGR